MEVAEVVAQPHCPIWFTHFTHLYTHPPYAIVSARPKVMSGYRSESLTYSDKNYRCIGVCWWNGPPGGIEGSAPDSRQTSSRPQPSSYGTTQFTLQAPPRRADPFSLLCGRSAAVRPPPCGADVGKSSLSRRIVDRQDPSHPLLRCCCWCCCSLLIHLSR